MNEQFKQYLERISAATLLIASTPEEYLEFMKKQIKAVFDIEIEEEFKKDVEAMKQLIKDTGLLALDASREEVKSGGFIVHPIGLRIPKIEKDENNPNTIIMAEMLQLLRGKSVSDAKYIVNDLHKKIETCTFL